MTNGQFQEQYAEQPAGYQRYPGGGSRYPGPPPAPYPMLELVSYILKMVGVMIIFFGVIGIAGWISDIDSYGGPSTDDLSDSVFAIGFGGLIASVSYLILGISRMQRGIIEVRTWMYTTK